jgi:glycosyltransferase involved in cell wall biosynthesis
LRLSLVVPCYNEEEALPHTAPQLARLMQDLIGRGKIASDSNIWFVDDGSKDGTWKLIERLTQESDLFVGVKLSRNRGHQNALLSGLMTADGDAVISIDADLQDDLRVIEEMVDAHAGGYEIVYGVRKARDTDTWFKRWSALRYYGLGQHAEVNLFLRGIIPQLGFRSTSVFYDRLDRVAGQSKYPLAKMVKLALDGITSFSPVPLRLIAGLGGIICVFSLVMAVWALVIRVFTDRALPGWASTTVPIYLLGGVQLLCIGILGEYVAKIYGETKGRPRYLIEKVERRTDSRRPNH